MSEVNKIVTIEQLKKAIQDYFKNVTKEKILDHYLTDDDIDALYAKYLELVNSMAESLEKSLSELNDKGWLDDRLKPSESNPEDGSDSSGESEDSELDDSSDIEANEPDESKTEE